MESSSGAGVAFVQLISTSVTISLVNIVICCYQLHFLFLFCSSCSLIFVCLCHDDPLRILRFILHDEHDLVHFEEENYFTIRIIIIV